MGSPTPERREFAGAADPLLTPTLRLPRVRRAAPPLTPPPPVAPAPLAARAALKVPQVIALFWVAKLLTTALGESTSDYLVFQPQINNPYIAVGIGALGLAIALVLQFVVRRYIAWVYWLAALMVAIVGTMAADVLHIVLGVSYLASTLFFIGALAAVFGVWYAVERTLSIHSIATLRRELFYWAAVMATFALGTAAGDMTAFTLRLGFFDSVLLFAALIGLVALAYWLLGLHEIVAFWAVYILTRPLGASIADWLGKPRAATGLGWGDGTVSALLFILVVIVVGYLAISRADGAPGPSPVREPRTQSGASLDARPARRGE